MAAILYKLTPKPLRRLIILTFRRIVNFGFKYRCPVCKSSFRSFKPFIGKEYSRPDASVCPVCKSFERHRLVWLFLQKKTDFFDRRPKSMLHIAPENMFEEKFKRISGMDYISGDLDPARAMIKMDITAIEYPDSSFDVIYCSHVLEHIPDDRKALRELCRVLKPGGWALLMVPVIRDKTFEDPSASDAQARRRLYGHPEHVRAIGPDYRDRMTEADFQVDVFYAKDFLENAQIEKMKLSNQPIFYCQKTG